MGRSRDIADMLSNTEISNTANERLLNEALNVGVDSAFVDGVVGQPLSFLSTLDSLPISSLASGQQAYVSSNNRLYISDGSGWYQKAFITLSPTITMDPSGTITLASDGTTTSTVTVVAIDSDTPGSGLTYSVDSDGNGIGKYVISQDSSVFTIRPLSSDSGATAGTFALTFSATDGVNIATDSSSFSLTFQSTGTLVRNTSYINEGGSVTFTLPVFGYQSGATIPYSITGISASDINEGLTGNMVVSGNNTPVSGGASKTITATADLTTEGTEYMTFSADNQSVNVQITDTSLTPLSPNIQLINEYTATHSLGGSSNWNWPGNNVHTIGSNIDYTYVNGKPRTVVVHALTWKQTNNGTGNYLHPSYGARTYNGGNVFFNVEQLTSFASARNTGMAFAWLPAANIGFYKPKFNWSNGGVDYFQWSQYTLYAEAGIDTSLIYFNHNYYNGQGSVGTSTGSTRKWDDYVMALGTVTPAPGGSPYPNGRMTYYSTYNMPIGQQGYMNGSSSSSGAYVHGRMDYYQYSSAINYNTYPRAPHLAILHFRT